jgi:hypothetical protein
VPVTPVCVVTEFGEVVFLESVVNDSRAEDILRSVTAVSGGMTGMCRCPMEGSVARKSTVHNTVSLCIEIGKIIRESASRGSNPVDAVLKRVKGYRFFEGKVKSFHREERGAFMWGEIEVAGSKDYSGHKLKIVFKNEHLISMLDGKPYVTCPDTICVLDAKTGLGLSNWGGDFSNGRQIVAFGIRANRFFRTKKGLESFSPKSFGYDFKHVPIETLIKKR